MARDKAPRSSPSDGIHLRLRREHLSATIRPACPINGNLLKRSMDYFQYQGNDVFCENIPLKRVAEETGTPAYIYSAATLDRHCRVLKEAFSRIIRRSSVTRSRPTTILLFSVASSPRVSALMWYRSVSSNVLCAQELARTRLYFGCWQASR